MITATKDFPFSASHRIDDLPDDHPCGRLHGHNYVVRVSLTGEFLDAVGWLIDWSVFAPFERYIVEFLDHRHLNGVIPDNPTAEAVAVYLIDVMYRVLELNNDDEPLAVSVGVSETPQTWAWVTAK